MFFVNMLKNPRIEKARLDGSEKTTLFMKQLQHPWYLTVDRTESKLYWADQALNRIEMSDIMGGNRRVLVDRQLKAPRGLALNGEYLYWLDRQQNFMQRSV